MGAIPTLSSSRNTSKDELAKAAMRFDFIISTVSKDVEWSQFINALAPEGRLCIVGVTESDLKIPAFPTISYERSVSGGRAGAPSDTAAMMEFCARHGVRPMCEQFEIGDVNRAVEHLPPRIPRPRKAGRG